ncbi:MAG TPA: hypothetical protein V6C65_04170 [Allocoleopsis sp.]
MGVGASAMLYGRRVALSRIGDGYYTLNYCAGSDTAFQAILLVTVMVILDRYPEDVTPRQIQDDFPSFQIKPINLDPYCWVRLQEMAQEKNNGEPETIDRENESEEWINTCS